jgi:hypothetical protein
MIQLWTMEWIIVDNTRFGYGPLSGRIFGKQCTCLDWSCIVWKPYDKLDEIIDSVCFLLLSMLGCMK